MPWIKDSNNEYKYIASKYTKEELPTWNEVYNEWYIKYKDDLYTFKTERDTEMDTYWNIPKKKYLLAVICNQFNKMISEDNFHIEEIEDIYNIHFSLYSYNTDLFRDGSTPIYSFKNPRGNENPFITSSPRNYISKDGDCVMVLQYTSYSSTSYEIDCDIMNNIVNQLMKPLIDYFENGIGWKDEDGNIINKEKVRWDRSTDSAL